MKTTSALLGLISVLLLGHVISCAPAHSTTLPREISKTTLVASAEKTATFYSDAYYLRTPNYSVYAKWSDITIGTATWTGTIRLQASLDGTNWENIASTDIAMSDSGSTYWNVGDASYLYGRVMGAVTAGSANVLVKVNKK